jgi:CheY-like chemotaxis protein
MMKARTRTKTSPAKSSDGCEPIEILLVEDNQYHARRTLSAFKDGRVRNTIHWVKDGVEALEYLRREGDYAAARRPHLILLDWYMPRMNGGQVLKEIKEDPELKRIPVVVMTTSTSEADVKQAYDLHANCYVTKPESVNTDQYINISKPVNVKEFMEKVRSIEDFWLTIVRLPAA